MANNTEGVGLREKLCNSMGFYLEEIDDGAINVPVGNQTLNNLEALIQQAELRGQVHIIKQEHSWISDVNDGIAYNLEKTIEQLEAQLKTLAEGYRGR